MVRTYLLAPTCDEFFYYHYSFFKIIIIVFPKASETRVGESQPAESTPK